MFWKHYLILLEAWNQKYEGMSMKTDALNETAHAWYVIYECMITATTLPYCVFSFSYVSNVSISYLYNVLAA